MGDDVLADRQLYPVGGFVRDQLTRELAKVKREAHELRLANRWLVEENAELRRRLGDLYWSVTVFCDYETRVAVIDSQWDGLTRAANDVLDLSA